MHGKELLPLLRTFALKARTPTVDLRQFVSTLPAGQVQPGDVENAAAEIAGSSLVIVSTEAGKPRIVALPDFPRMALVDLYKQLPIEPTRPFPKEDSLPAPIPQGDVVAADVKAQLGTLIEASGPERKGIVKLMFPEGVDSLIVAEESVGVDLIEGAVAKLSYYLQSAKNAAYAESKLASALKGNEVAVRQSLEDVAVRPKKAASTVLTPTDFTFRFWTHLSNLVIQDMRAKSEKTSLDQGVCQSAYIVGYAVFHKKGAVQRERQLAEDRRSLEAQMRKAPFLFGYQELYDLKDEKGTTFASRHGRDFIHSFLKEKAAPSADESLPSLVRLRAASQNKDYFIHRDLLVPVFLRKLVQTSEDLRGRYVDEWTSRMREDEAPAASRSDAAFRREVEIRVKEDYPVLVALADGNLLHLAGAEGRIADQSRQDLARCFSTETTLLPFDELLGLNRQEILKTVRTYLPFWLTTPVLSLILRILRRIFKGHRVSEDIRPSPAARAKSLRMEGAKVVLAGGAPTNGVDGALTAAGRGGAGGGAVGGAAGARKSPKTQKANLREYQRAIQALASAYVSPGGSISATLEELAEKWNPLFAAAQKQDLVEDVNALVRDFLRPVRKSFLAAPPDLKRIRALTEQLSTSQSLAKIKKRDPLLRYIELYMIQCLQVKPQ